MHCLPMNVRFAPQKRKFNILDSAADSWSAIVMAVEAAAAQNIQKTFPALDAVSAGPKVRSGANGASTSRIIAKPPQQLHT
jgi:hypothetical protein